MKLYTLTTDGIDHTVQLDDDDAKRLGLTGGKPLTTTAAAADDEKSRAPANKSRTASDK